MTNEQLFLVAMGPFATLIVVMFGVFLDGRQLEGVRREIDGVRREIEALRNELRGDPRRRRELEVDIAKLDQRIAAFGR